MDCNLPRAIQAVQTDRAKIDTMDIDAIDCGTIGKSDDDPDTPIN